MLTDFCMSTLTASLKRTSGGSAPVLSTVKMKWSLTRASCTRSSQPAARAASRPPAGGPSAHGRGRAWSGASGVVGLKRPANGTRERRRHQ